MNKSEQFLATQELVEHLWEGYKVKKDPRWLAEICLNVPFFDHPEIGKEIAKRLQASFHDVNQIDEQTMRNDIWKLWQTYKGSDTDVAQQDDYRLCWTDAGFSDPQDRTFASLGQIQQQIVKFVKSHPSCTQTAIVEGIGKSKQQVNEAVNRLRELGIIKLVEGKKLICFIT